MTAFYDILKKRLTLHSDISSYCLFLSHSIACDANIFSCIIPVTTRDVQLFGVWQLNPRFFPSYLRFRKTRGITAQKQRSWSFNYYILWHFCELDRNWKRGEEQKSFQTITLECDLVQNHPLHTLKKYWKKKKGNKLSLYQLIIICTSFKIFQWKANILMKSISLQFLVDTG